MAIIVLVSTFQSFIVLSMEPLTKIVPLLLNKTDETEQLFPSSVAISVLISTFHSFIVLSIEPLAKIVPSLLNATD